MEFVGRSKVSMVEATEKIPVASSKLASVETFQALLQTARNEIRGGKEKEKIM